ncbi:MAG: hemolysin family protein [Chlorobi bacterium]|nr:hemolysin family protein [Chlorobiota bacterium]
MLSDIVLTAALVGLNAFFVAAEFALVKIRSSHVEIRARTGSFLARMIRSIIGHLDGYLSATQLGITLASLGLGWIGEPVVARMIEAVMVTLGIELPPHAVHRISLPVAFGLITILHIVLGELAPKSLAIQHSEAVAYGVALPLRAFYIVFKPAIWLLNGLAQGVLRMLRIRATPESELHSAEEIRYLLEESQRSGLIAAEQHELLENIFELPQRQVRHIMVPRPRIVALELTMTTEQILDIVLEEGYSRMPVYRDTLDNIVGIVYTKDLLSLVHLRNLIILEDIIRPFLTVSENESLYRLLRLFQSEQVHMAIVTDEFGGTAGLVTLEDVLEEIVGEIRDEYDQEAAPVQRQRSDYIVQATTTIADLNEYLPVPLPESPDYKTLGGLILQQAGKIPAIGDIFAIPPYRAEVLRATERMVELVKLQLESAQAGHEGE